MRREPGRGQARGEGPEVLICCGSGGVGKTTTSAAAAIRLARGGRRVAVLTIDPARRLADALGLAGVNDGARRVPVGGPGTVDALMLDAKGTFDGIVRRYAPDAAAERRILENHYYRYVSERLAGVHEYMAMERLLQLATEGGPEGGYDALVLDTPPARHALDFLEAPARMSRLMDEGVMRWLTLPGTSGGWRMIERGSEVLARVLNSLLGEGTIRDIAEFFSAFQTLWEGFRERSLRVEAMLSSPRTRFVLVTTPAPAARAGALAFLEALQVRRKRLAGFVLNRCLLPLPAQEMGRAPPPGADPARWGALAGALSELPERHRRMLAAQEEAIQALTGAGGPGVKVWRLPEWEELGEAGAQAGATVEAGATELQRIGQLAGYLPDLEELG